MARPATNKSIPDTMMRAGSRATCSTRFGSRPRLTSVEAPSATNVGPTNAAMDFDAVALSTLKTPAGFVPSLLFFYRSVAQLPAFGKLGERTRVPRCSSIAPAVGRPNVDLGSRPSAQIGEQRVYLIGFVADLTQVLE